MPGFGAAGAGGGLQRLQSQGTADSLATSVAAVESPPVTPAPKAPTPYTPPTSVVKQLQDFHISTPKEGTASRDTLPDTMKSAATLDYGGTIAESPMWVDNQLGDSQIQQQQSPQDSEPGSANTNDAKSQAGECHGNDRKDEAPQETPDEATQGKKDPGEENPPDKENVGVGKPPKAPAASKNTEGDQGKTNKYSDGTYWKYGTHFLTYYMQVRCGRFEFACVFFISQAKVA